MLEKNISIFIEEQFPTHFRREGALLVQFITYYYTWLEEEGNVTDISRRIQDFNDPDTIPDQFLEFLRTEFLSGIPATLKVDQRMLLKNILGFYKARGTEASYRLLFRILFNTEINVYYPGDDILRASDGKWYVGKRIDISPLASWGDDYSSISEIRGVVSGALARVENIIPVIENGITVYKTYLYSIRGTFVKDEPIYLRYSDDPIGNVISEGLVTEDGTWLNTDGHLSSNKYLQDNFYYQEFSYEIQSGVGLSSYRDIVTGLVHPAGTKLFGKVLSDIIIDISMYSDIDFENWTSQSNDNFIEIDGSNLDVFADETKRIDIILDRSLQEFAGTGSIAINDGQISDFSGFTIADFGRTPISLIGTRHLIVGTGTLFDSEIAQPNGPIAGHAPAVMRIIDTGNSAIEQYQVDVSYSNRFLTLADDYFYPSMTGGTFNIIRSVYQEDYGYDQYISIPGTGTITWNNGTQLFNGTSTIFGMEVDIEDIIEIIATGDRYMVNGVGNNTLMSVFTGEGTLTATITNQPFRVYKNFTNPNTGGDGFITWNAQFMTHDNDYLTWI